jgi:hypothetical protein
MLAPSNSLLINCMVFCLIVTIKLERLQRDYHFHGKDYFSCEGSYLFPFPKVSI